MKTNHGFMPCPETLFRKACNV